jgi:APA family basic amino acid/polyamine antiporter
MTAVLAWVSARYTLVVFGYSEAPLAFVEGTKSTLNSPEVITLALFYLVLAFFINAIAPRLAGKFQISATVIKLIPIVIIALVGTVAGLINGNLGANIAIGELGSASGNGGLLAAICTTVFAYDGWIVATSINSEIKDAKKNLPIALCLGTLIIVIAYTLFNVGLFGLANIGDIATGGTTVAYNFFGGAAAAIINILVVISCLGTLNGLMLGGSRGIYSLSARGEGFYPETFAQVDKVTGIPHNSAIFSLMMSGGWFLYFLLLGSGLFDFGVASKYAFDSSELPIVTLYAMYIPILVAMMIKEKELGAFRRFVLPSLSIVGIGVIVYACVSKHGIRNVWYLIVFAIFMVVGAIVQMKNKKEAVN